jgi:hypothetical protein
MLSFEVVTIFILLRMTTFWLFVIRVFFLALDLVNFRKINIQNSSTTKQANRSLLYSLIKFSISW